MSDTGKMIFWFEFAAAISFLVVIAGISLVWADVREILAELRKLNERKP